MHECNAMQILEKKKERKMKHIIVFALFSVFFENKVGQFIFT